jgi:uncharacterized protein
VREPIPLSDTECQMLLRGGIVGRIAVTTRSGPHIVPVNYAVVDDAVVVRTAADSVLGSVTNGTRVAFEIDHVDHEQQLGWSVVVHGRVEWLEDPERLAQVASVWPPRPWAAGNRPRHLFLRWRRIEGRRIGSGWDLQPTMPVRRSV